MTFVVDGLWMEGSDIAQTIGHTAPTRHDFFCQSVKIKCGAIHVYKLRIFTKKSNYHAYKL